MSLYTSDQGHDPNRNGAVLCVGGRMDGWGVWEIYWPPKEEPRAQNPQNPGAAWSRLLILLTMIPEVNG